VQCPYCGGDSSVGETRVVADGLRRRRLCNACKRRFTTYEKAGAPGLKVQKRDGSVEPFDTEKLVVALRRVGRWRSAMRPEDAARVARGIEASLVDSGQKLVRWSDIASAALDRLQAIDPVAAQRFAANYADESGTVRFEQTAVDVSAPQLALPGVDED
jgi:transcriptional repressor NrdR